MVDRPVRYALVGYGTGGAVFHAPMITTCPGAELTAVVARSEATRARAAADIPGVQVLPDMKRLSDLGVDVVVVATPNVSHAPLAREAIESGLGVVVDKPLATGVAEAEELITAADRAGVLLTCYQNRRWDSDFLTTHSCIRDGSLGRVHRFESRFERWRPQIKHGWKEGDGPGTGVLWDLGPHLIDQALTLFGPAREVYAEVRTIRPDALTADDVFLAITHLSGVRSLLWASLVAAQSGPRMRVLGTEGAFVKHSGDGQEDALRAGRTPADARWGAEPESQWGRLRRGDEEIAVPSQRGDYRRFYELMTAAVRGEGDVPVDPREALENVRIIEAALADHT